MIFPGHELLLAANDLSDILEIVFVIVVIAVSAVASMSKKLIEFFSKPQSSAQEDRTEGRRARSAFPTARPMPPSRTASPPAGPTLETGPAAAPSPPGTFVRRIGPIVVEVRDGTIHVRSRESDKPAPGPARPAAGPRPVGEVLPRRPAKRSVRPRPERRAAVTEVRRTMPPPPPAAPARPAARPEERLGRAAEAADEHLGHLSTEVEKRVGRFGADVEQHLGHLTRRLGGSSGAPVHGLSISGGDISTAAGLRQAVILSELLAPPLALRPPAERS